MSRLTEKYIQKQSVQFLKDHYENKFEIEIGFAKQEVRTNKENNGKRADGLLCFHSSRQKEHTVSIEAKSHKTLGSLLAYWDDDKLMKQFLLFAFPVGLMTIYFTSSMAWYWISLIALGSFLLSIALFVIITFFLELEGHKVVNVVNQVNQYPANEKWIAISKDSLNLTHNKKSEFYKNNNFDNFTRKCKNQNIGILIVTRRKNEILVHPNYIKGKYLDCYCLNENIRSILN